MLRNLLLRPYPKLETMILALVSSSRKMDLSDGQKSKDMSTLRTEDSLSKTKDCLIQKALALSGTMN